MTTETLLSHVASLELDITETGPAIEEPTPSGGHRGGRSDLVEPEPRSEFQQVIVFLNLTLKESFHHTVYTFLQDLKCTYLLLSELHKPYVDSIRLLFPLWLTVIHAICLVILVLAHKTIVRVTARLRGSLSEPLSQVTTWTQRHVHRVFQPLASRLDAVLSSVLPSDPCDTTKH